MGFEIDTYEPRRRQPIASGSRSMRRVIASIALVAVLLVGCGGGGESSVDERQVRSVERQYVIALARSDYGKACSLFTNEGRAEWRDTGRRQVGTPTCPAGIKSIFGKAYSLKDLKEAKSFQPLSVQITDNRAVAISGNSESGRIPFSKVGGRWLIDNAEHVDHYDAGAVADGWADAQTRAGETFKRESCTASGDGQKELWDEFGCPVRFQPSGRGYFLYLRAVDEYRGVKLIRVLRGANHDFPP